MKFTLKKFNLTVPDDVELGINARVVTVKGPRGALTLNFKHTPIDISFVPGSNNKEVQLDRWFGSGKSLSTVKSVHSHITNGIIGVTKGFQYKMRFVYAHFPINVTITNKDKRIEIRNFLGEKVVRVVDALGDVTVKRSTDVKDEIILSGTSIDAVSRTCALVSQICNVKNKDIRKFLDGIYVSHKGNIDA